MEYYWTPCAICQKKFAGFEDGGYLMINAGMGKHVCPDCTVEAERLNKINMPRFMEEYGKLYDKLDTYEQALTYRNTPTILLPGELLVLAPKIYRIRWNKRG